MSRKYQVLLLGGCGAILLFILCLFASFRWSVARSVVQHRDALGRQISYRLVEGASGEIVTVPPTVAYSVRDPWPMNYELHLRAGYRFPLDSTKRTNAVIGYLLAQPNYPFWARATGWVPSSKELLILHEDFSVLSDSKDRLADLTNGW
jgi:hypothetical protein